MFSAASKTIGGTITLKKTASTCGKIFNKKPTKTLNHLKMRLVLDSSLKECTNSVKGLIILTSNQDTTTCLMTANNQRFKLLLKWREWKWGFKTSTSIKRVWKFVLLPCSVRLSVGIWDLITHHSSVIPASFLSTSSVLPFPFLSLILKNDG